MKTEVKLMWYCSCSGKRSDDSFNWQPFSFRF